MNFWGLRVIGGKSYKQTVLKDYHVSHAVLDTSTVTLKEIVSLRVEVNGNSFILCNLSLDHGILQVPLECNFNKGEVVVFSISSESEGVVVHLSGYTIDKSSCSNCKGKTDSNGAIPLANVTNVKAKTSNNSNRICKDEPSIKEDKENKSPFENKEKDKKTSKKNKNKKSKSEKEISLTDMLSSVDDEEEDDDDYTPEVDEEAEEEEEENENEEIEEDADEEEEELILEEEEEENDDSDDESVELEETEENMKDSKDDDDDEMLNDLPEKKRRRLSESSIGRTPIPKAGKKLKIDYVKDSSTTNENLSKKKKNKKSAVKDSTFDNENVFMNKTPKKSEKKNETLSSGEKSDASPSSESIGNKRMVLGGVVLEDLVIGTGAKATTGKKVSVYYEGKFLDGKVFDKVKKGSCFKFKLGAKEVIKAWDIGIVGMKVGGKRKIVAPPGMAYGNEGCPPVIPPKTILTFEVELKGVNK